MPPRVDKRDHLLVAATRLGRARKVLYLKTDASFGAPPVLSSCRQAARRFGMPRDRSRIWVVRERTLHTSPSRGGPTTPLAASGWGAQSSIPGDSLHPTRRNAAGHPAHHGRDGAKRDRSTKMPSSPWLGHDCAATPNPLHPSPC